MKYLAVVIILYSANLFSCSKEEAMLIEPYAYKIKSWTELDRAFSQFEHCDDGAIADGFTGSVAYLLGNKWDELSYLEDKPELYKFVLKHIDEAWTRNEHRIAVKNAKAYCPDYAESICKALNN